MHPEKIGGCIVKELSCDGMLDRYEETPNGDWVEVMPYVDFEAVNATLFNKEKFREVPNPKITPWVLKRDGDKAIREAACLHEIVYPECEVMKSTRSFVEKCAAATWRYILNSGASSDLVGQQGLDAKEQKDVTKARIL